MIDKCSRMSSSKACSSFNGRTIISSSISISEAKQMVKIHPRQRRQRTTTYRTYQTRRQGVEHLLCAEVGRICCRVPGRVGEAAAAKRTAREPAATTVPDSEEICRRDSWQIERRREGGRRGRGGATRNKKAGTNRSGCGRRQVGAHLASRCVRRARSVPRGPGMGSGRWTEGAFGPRGWERKNVRCAPKNLWGMRLEMLLYLLPFSWNSTSGVVQ
jgi:hypothetical protein